MTSLMVLIPAALALGALGLVAFLWALRAGQFDDLDSAATRILFDDVPPSPADINAAAPPGDPRKQQGDA